MKNRAFKFLLDPLFVFALALYLTNRYLLAPAEFYGCQFCEFYLSDLLLVPVLVPIILSVSRFFKFRNDSSPPTILEIGLPLTIWSVAFELIGPFVFGAGTSDPLDVLAYFVGGLVSWLIWNRQRKVYRSKSSLN